MTTATHADTSPADKLTDALVESDGQLQAAHESEVAKLDDQLERHGEAIDRLRRKNVLAILGIGEHLDAVHQLLAGVGRDGAFTPWVKKRCGFSLRSARNYLDAFRTFGKCATVAHFDAKAIYLLASPSCPEEATNEAMRLAEKGESISHQKAKELRSRWCGSVTDDGNLKEANEEPDAVDSSIPRVLPLTNVSNANDQPPSILDTHWIVDHNDFRIATYVRFTLQDGEWHSLDDIANASPEILTRGYVQRTASEKDRKIRMDDRIETQTRCSRALIRDALIIMEQLRLLECKGPDTKAQYRFGKGAKALGWGVSKEAIPPWGR